MPSGGRCRAGASPLSRCAGGSPAQRRSGDRRPDRPRVRRRDRHRDGASGGQTGARSRPARRPRASPACWRPGRSRVRVSEAVRGRSADARHVARWVPGGGARMTIPTARPEDPDRRVPRSAGATHRAHRRTRVRGRARRRWPGPRVPHRLPGNAAGAPDAARRGPRRTAVPRRAASRAGGGRGRDPRRRADPDLGGDRGPVRGRVVGARAVSWSRGPLRGVGPLVGQPPARVQARLAADDRFDAYAFGLASALLGELRAIKDPDEIALLRMAAHAADRSSRQSPPAGWSGGPRPTSPARSTRRLIDEEPRRGLVLVASGPNSASRTTTRPTG